MKKEKEKEKKKIWCPLYGYLPTQSNKPEVHYCNYIIFEARDILGRNLYFRDHPKLEIIKTFFENARDITDCLISPSSVFEQENTLLNLLRIYRHEKISHYEGLAILAIYEARKALLAKNKDIVKHHANIAGEILRFAKDRFNRQALKTYDEEIKFKEKKIEEMQPIAEYGKKFKDGPKKPRKDDLNETIEDTYLTLKEKEKEPTAKEVFNALPLNECVQEKDDDIYWRTRRGKERKTSYKSFLNRFTKIKKESRL